LTAVAGYPLNIEHGAYGQRDWRHDKFLKQIAAK